MHLIAPALPRLRERHPALSIDQRLTDRMVDIVDEGIDVATRVGELADSRLISRRLASHRAGAFGSTAYLARRGTPRHPDDLAEHECVNFRYQSCGQALRWPFQAGGCTVEHRPAAGIVTDLSDGVAAVLEAGRGIGISPTYLAATSAGDAACCPSCSTSRPSGPSSPRSGRRAAAAAQRARLRGAPRRDLSHASSLGRGLL